MIPNDDSPRRDEDRSNLGRIVLNGYTAHMDLKPKLTPAEKQEKIRRAFAGAEATQVWNVEDDKRNLSRDFPLPASERSGA